jgi:hypothetical protein
MHIKSAVVFIAVSPLNKISHVAEKYQEQPRAKSRHIWNLSIIFFMGSGMKIENGSDTSIPMPHPESHALQK